MPDYFRFVFLFGLPPCFLVMLVFGSMLFWCAYWSSYSTSYSWAFLDRASEGMIGTGIVVSLIQGFRDSQDFASSLHLFSTSTTSPKLPVSPSPLQYDGWHTFASFPSSKGPAKPPPWPSFPTRLFPLLCKCFLVHMSCGSTIWCCDVNALVGMFGNCTLARPPLLATHLLTRLSPWFAPRNPSHARLAMVPSLVDDHWQCFCQCSVIWVVLPLSIWLPRRTCPKPFASTGAIKVNCSPTSSHQWNWNGCKGNSSPRQTP